MQLSRRSTLKLLAGSALLGYGLESSVAWSLSSQPLKIPRLDTGNMKEGVRHFDLQLARGTAQFFDNVQTPSYSVNGNYLGPSLKFVTGESVQLNVSNKIGTASTLHWHGLHLPAAADGGPHQIIEDGGSWQAKFDVKQHAATFWYHSHMLHETGFQVYHGLAGLILVEHEATGNFDLPQDYGIDDIPLVIQDRRFNGDGSLEYLSSMHDRMMGMQGDHLLVNGTIRPHFVAATDTIRLRLLNGSNARIYALAFSDNRQFKIIATDGGLLEQPVDAKSISLAPAERMEIILDVSDGRPVSLVSSTAPQGGMMGRMMSDNSRFTVLEILPDEARAAAIELPAKLVRLPSLDASAAVRTRKFTLNMNMGPGMMMRGRGGAMSINGKPMDKDRVDERVKINTQEIWIIENPTRLSHPFHIHDVQFRILDRNGSAPPLQEAGLKDTVLIPSGESVRLLLRFSDYADPDRPYMYHCHILEHEDAGMMGQFTVSA